MKAWFKRWKWWIVGAVVLAVVAAGFVFGRSGTSEAIETVHVGYATVRDEVDVTATVQSTERYDLSFSAAGVLKTLSVKEGDVVEEGQVLATLEASDASAQVAAARAALVGDLELAEVSYGRAQSALADAEAVNAAKIEEAKQTVRNAKTSLDTAREQFQRVSDEGYDESSAVYTSAEAGYVAAQNAYAAAQKSLATLKDSAAQAEAAAQADVQAAQTSLQLKQRTIVGAGISSVNQATLQYQQALFAKTVLRAPAAGVIGRIVGDIGEYVTPTTVVVTMVLPSVELVAYVPETDAAKLAVGDPATVTFDAFRDSEFTAHVSAIDSLETVIEGVTTYKVTLGFAEQDERLRSGLGADVVILADEREHVLTIPQRAVLGSVAHRQVDVIRGEGTERVDITTGLRGSDGSIEVVSGLVEGDEVVTFDPNATE